MEAQRASMTVVTSRSLFRPSLRYGKRATAAQTFLILSPVAPLDHQFGPNLRTVQIDAAHR
jgi:hypothetical protein